jgi:hypothetical protein
MECTICCEIVRQKISCPFCIFWACKICFSRMVLNRPVCEGCKKQFSDLNIKTIFGTKFFNEAYKEKKKDEYFAVEEQQFQESSSELFLEQQLKKWNLKRKRLLWQSKNPDLNKQEREEIIIKLQHLLQKFPKKEKTKNIQIWKCNCGGYVLKNVCNKCATVFCARCFETTSTSHQCNDSVLKSVQLIQKDSKNCPKCKSLVFKIDGCDQMFCTICYTAFSWQTLCIVTSRVHNPHYYELLQKGVLNREIMDIPCGGIPSITDFPENLQMSRIIRCLVDFQESNTVSPIDNADIRKKFLLGTMNQKVFKNTLFARYKRFQFNTEVAGIKATFITCVSDLLRNLLENKNMEQFITSYKILLDITKKHVAQVKKDYKYEINIDFSSINIV